MAKSWSQSGRCTVRTAWRASQKGATMKTSRFSRPQLWLVVFLFACPIAAVAQTYIITNLGTLGGSYSAAHAINASGQITGSSYTGTGYKVSHAFLYSGGKMIDLGTLGGSFSYGLAINTSGQVAGTSALSNGRYRGFFSNGGRLTNVGTLGGSTDYSDAEGINDAGQVVGG